MINLANNFSNKNIGEQKKSAGLGNMHMSNPAPAPDVQLNGATERKMELWMDGRGGGERI